MPANDPILPTTSGDPTGGGAGGAAAGDAARTGTTAAPDRMAGAHRRPAPTRTRLYRGLTVGLLATSLTGAAVAGTLLNRHGPRPTNPATVEEASVERSLPAVANRGHERTAPSPSAAASAAPAPGSPAPKPSTAAPQSPATRALTTKAAPAVPAGCAGWTGVRLTACTLLPEFGLSPSEMSALDALWEGESNWNVYATNPSSGAYGIPQSLPAEKMAAAGADWQTNAATQIRWGLDYIVDVYGTPGNALAQWQARSPHWY